MEVDFGGGGEESTTGAGLLPTPDAPAPLPLESAPPKPHGLAVGTEIRRKFPGYGWYDGRILTLDGRWCLVEWSDETQTRMPVDQAERCRRHLLERELSVQSSSSSSSSSSTTLAVVSVSSSDASTPNSSSREENLLYDELKRHFFEPPRVDGARGATFRARLGKALIENDSYGWRALKKRVAALDDCGRKADVVDLLARVKIALDSGQEASHSTVARDAFGLDATICAVLDADDRLVSQKKHAQNLLPLSRGVRTLSKRHQNVVRKSNNKKRRRERSEEEEEDDDEDRLVVVAAAATESAASSSSSSSSSSERPAALEAETDRGGSSHSSSSSSSGGGGGRDGAHHQQQQQQPREDDAEASSAAHSPAAPPQQRDERHDEEADDAAPGVASGTRESTVVPSPSPSRSSLTRVASSAPPPRNKPPRRPLFVRVAVRLDVAPRMDPARRQIFEFENTTRRRDADGDAICCCPEKYGFAHGQVHRLEPRAQRWLELRRRRKAAGSNNNNNHDDDDDMLVVSFLVDGRRDKKGRFVKHKGHSVARGETTTIAVGDIDRQALVRVPREEDDGAQADDDAPRTNQAMPSQVRSRATFCWASLQGYSAVFDVVRSENAATPAANDGGGSADAASHGWLVRLRRAVVDIADIDVELERRVGVFVV